MMLRRFDHRTDLDALNHWYAAHGQASQTLGMLPSVGFIVPDMAAGFLFQTDSKIAYVDAVVSNPASDKAARSTALDAVFGALEAYARVAGFKRVIGLCLSPAAEQRAVDHGCVPYGAFALVMKEL